MKKITPKHLSKRLAQYGALSIAIAGIADANGQIVYTDVDDEGGVGVEYTLDLDGDGIIDFKIEHSHTSTSSYINDLFINRNFNTQNGVLGDLINGDNLDYIYPFALDSGALISNGDSNWNDVEGNMYLNIRSCNIYTNSNWCNGESEGTDKFLGLRFEISGNVHYGWARLSVGTNPTNWVIKDYAYESTAGIGITAGDTGVLGLDDNVFSTVKIVALNKSIALFNLPQQTDYKLFSLTGQSVLDGKITNNTHVIEANTLATGIYIIELKDKSSNALIRKKIVL